MRGSALAREDFDAALQAGTQAGLVRLAERFARRLRWHSAVGTRDVQRSGRHRRREALREGTPKRPKVNTNGIPFWGRRTTHGSL